MKIVKKEVQEDTRNIIFYMGDVDTTNMVWHYCWDTIGRHIRLQSRGLIAMEDNVLWRDLIFGL